MPRPVAYIAHGGIWCSPNKLTKLEARAITESDIREAVEGTDIRWSAWAEDARGRRLIVVGTTYAGRVLTVVLYPRHPDDGLWNLGTAMDGDCR